MPQVRNIVFTFFFCLIAAFGLVVALASFPPAVAEIVNGNNVESLPSSEEYHSVFTQANQIKFLLGSILFLIGGHIFWLKRYMSKNDAFKKDIYDRHNKLENEFSGLRGEHDMSMSFRGCAADPTIMEDTVEKTVKKTLEPLVALLSEYHLHKREEDREENKDESKD